MVPIPCAILFHYCAKSMVNDEKYREIIFSPNEMCINIILYFRLDNSFEAFRVRSEKEFFHTSVVYII